MATKDTNKRSHPDSIDEALSSLDQALASSTGNMSEFETEQHRDVQAALGQMDARTTMESSMGGTSAGGSFADTIRDLGTQYLGQLGLQGGLSNNEAISSAMERGRQIYSDVDVRVRANPWPVIGGIAVGTFALGFLLGRNNSGTSRNL